MSWSMVMSEKSRSLHMKPSLTPKIKTGGNLPSRNRLSLSFRQIRSELTVWCHNISLHWSSLSTRSSTPSRTSRGLGARDQSNTTPLPGAKEYCSYHDCKRHNTLHCWALWKYLEELIQQDLLKEYILTLEATSGSGQVNVSSLIQLQHLIT